MLSRNEISTNKSYVAFGSLLSLGLNYNPHILLV